MATAALTWSPPASAEELQKEFSRLVQQWRRERGPGSSMTKIIMHPAYQRIIGMGPAALPLIIDDLRCSPDFWHWALHSITGEQPVPKEHAGNVKAIAEDWINWAKSKGYPLEAADRTSLSKSG
ncbi:MAG TPA: hypothetical protein VGN88_09975 [Phycisphaerae bacterium]|jgi:hypothetical protein